MEHTQAIDPRSRTVKVISLIGAGHFYSHFYMLLLPPLFPMLREVYGVGFTELGFAITAFSITTGITQAPVGFLVDRYGARTLLIGGLLLESLAFALIGYFPWYGALLVLMIAAGLANAVFHPADYAILNASVSEKRMGRAFSIHTFAGLLGAAAAPVTMSFLMRYTDWKTALAVCGSSGAFVAVLIMLNARILDEATDSDHRVRSAGQQISHRGWRLLFSVPVLMGLLFFLGISMSNHGINTFSVSALTERYGVSLAEAGTVLSAYLFAAPVGVLVGGWVADRNRHHHLFAAGCFAVIACVAFSVAMIELPTAAIAVLFAIAGLFSGAVSPSRDMMIRSVTPPGEMGKVFGFVSVGFNIGGIMAPPLFGYILDNTQPSFVFLAVGLFSLATICTVLVTGQQAKRRV